jgi:hypothetical protein
MNTSCFKPFIIEKFAGAIWRLELDELNHILFAEVRRVEDKTVSFTAIGLNTGEVLFKDLTLDERWLTGIEAAYNGVLLLHGYLTDDSPVHRGLTAIDAHTGSTLWTNYNLTFDRLSVNGPVVFDGRIQPAKRLLAEISTGATLRAYEPAVDLEPDSSLTVPEIIPAKSLSLPVEAYGNAVHKLEYNNRHIVSLHTIYHNELQQELFVMDGNTIIFKDLLNGPIQKMQPEAFMLFSNYLIYIKDRSAIHVLFL